MCLTRSKLDVVDLVWFRTSRPVIFDCFDHSKCVLPMCTLMWYSWRPSAANTGPTWETLHLHLRRRLWVARVGCYNVFLSLTLRSAGLSAKFRVVSVLLSRLPCDFHDAPPHSNPPTHHFNNSFSRENKFVKSQIFYPRPSGIIEYVLYVIRSSPLVSVDVRTVRDSLIVHTVFDSYYWQ